jgi:hypothetical protein
MSLDLKKLANKIDEALSNESTETLTKFINDKRMTNNKQQTAVEWGIEKLASLTFDYMAGFISKREYDQLSKGVIQQAKEMEKEQIAEAYWNGSDGIEDKTSMLKIGENYYNETYGGNK